MEIKLATRPAELWCAFSGVIFGIAKYATLAFRTMVACVRAWDELETLGTEESDVGTHIKDGLMPVFAKISQVLLERYSSDNTVGVIVV